MLTKQQLLTFLEETNTPITRAEDISQAKYIRTNLLWSDWLQTVVNTIVIQPTEEEVNKIVACTRNLHSPYLLYQSAVKLGYKIRPHLKVITKETLCQKLFSVQ